MKTLLLILSLSGALPAGAIELSLEENRAERGSIGYVDMQKLFRQFPETLRAKENFEEVLRQAEEQINLRKAEILRLRNELSQLKIEREFIARTPLIISTPAAVTAPQAPLPAPAPVAPSTATASAAPPAETLVSTRPPLSSLPGFAGTEPRRTEPLIINIPGVSTAPIVVEPPSAPVPPPQASTVAFTPPPQSPAVSTAPAVNPALVEMDAKIALKAKDLAQREAEFREHQAGAEKNLLELESRKTEILLGKIHKAVQEVARREGVSVVIDKGSILFGHNAVDLTDKVIKHLGGGGS